MLGIPIFAVWLIEAALFVVVLGYFYFGSETPWWAVLGLIGAVILLVLIGWGIFNVGRDGSSRP
jgi:hypothetical protein